MAKKPEKVEPNITPNLFDTKEKLEADIKSLTERIEKIGQERLTLINRMRAEKDVYEKKSRIDMCQAGALASTISALDSERCETTKKLNESIKFIDKLVKLGRN